MDALSKFKENSNFTSIGLIVLGAILIISGNLVNSSLISIVGFVIFIPSIIAYATGVSNNVLNLLDDNEDSFNSIFIVIVIGLIGTLIILKSNYVVNLLLLGGAILLISGIVNDRSIAPPAKVEYRFVPRTFKEEQEAPVKVSQIFNDLFTRPTPWPTGSFDDNQTNFIGKRVLDDIQYSDNTLPFVKEEDKVCSFKDIGMDKDISIMIKNYYESPEVLGGKYEITPLQLTRQIDELRTKSIKTTYTYKNISNANDSGTATRIFSLAFDDQNCKWSVVSMTNTL